MAAKKRTSGRRLRPEVRPVDKHYKLLQQLYQPVVDARERFHRQIDDAKATYLRARQSWANQAQSLKLPAAGPAWQLSRVCDSIAYAYDRLIDNAEPHDPAIDFRAHFVCLDAYEALLPKARAEVAKAEAKHTKAAKRAQKNGTSRP